MRFKRKERADTPPDITPMIDVVFLLLIFFMLSTTFVVSPGIKVDLPKSSAEEIRKEREEIKVLISAEGEYYIGEERHALESLEAIFREAAQTSRESVVVISADERAAHGRVVAVMDGAKLAGVTRLAIETKSK